MTALVKTDTFGKGMVEKAAWTRYKGRVIVSCPMCGNLGGIDNHTINEKGEVTPSVRTGCQFSEMVKLLGWES